MCVALCYVLCRHPDKNPSSCTDCTAQFRLISSAYQVLSDSTARSHYDSLELAYQPIASAALTLTTENFDALVASAGGSVWLVEVYSDWHKSCISFATAWEVAGM